MIARAWRLLRQPAYILLGPQNRQAYALAALATSRRLTVTLCYVVLQLLQVFARASKYSLFDPAKEMVYIEMDSDEKKQGKAAVDLVGSQVSCADSQCLC